MLGVPEDDTHFDTDILTHINSAIMTLHQNGIGPDKMVSVYDATTTWDEFEEEECIAQIKAYIYFYTKLRFDPPASSTIMDAIKMSMDELLWRMRLSKELGND